jgi:lipid A 3-O-deacylase
VTFADHKCELLNPVIKAVSILFVLFLPIVMSGQTSYRDQELAIVFENDVFLLQNKDQYYSNGMIINYRFIPGLSNVFRGKSNDSIKHIISFELAHKFYTPFDIKRTDVRTFDRPYSGTLNAYAGITKFSSKDVAWTYGLELGIVGKASGAEAFQTWYHAWANFPEPQGWEYQIKNELYLNLKGEFNKQFFLLPRTIDVVTYSKITLGSTRFNVDNGFDLRFGRLQSINQSAFKNSLIGKGSEKFVGHNYIFVGLGAEYVVHNTLIEGSIWSDKDPHTEEVVNWVKHLRVGWALNSANTTFKMTYYYLSEEVVGADVHGYIGFELDLRFKPSKRRKQ